jgi:hypothetical protein
MGRRERRGVSSDFTSGCTGVGIGELSEVGENYLQTTYGHERRHSLRHGHAFVSVGSFHVIEEAA